MTDGRRTHFGKSAVDQEAFWVIAAKPGASSWPQALFKARCFS
jgi:hypothetical protein